MRLFIPLFSMFMIFSSTIYAQSNKSDLFDGCIKRSKSESYCNCAIGKPYDELVSRQSNINIDRLNRQLDKSKLQHKKLYDQDMSKGGINSAQIKRICNIVDEYYQFMEENGLAYKKIGHKNLITSSIKDLTPITSETRQKMTVKRREINKKIHDLNNEYQRAGVMGSFTTLSNGVCYVKNQIEWLEEEIEKQKKEVKTASVNIGLRSLLSYSQNICGNLE